MHVLSAFERKLQSLYLLRTYSIRIGYSGRSKPQPKLLVTCRLLLRLRLTATMGDDRQYMCVWERGKGMCGALLQQIDEANTHRFEWICYSLFSCARRELYRLINNSVLVAQLSIDCTQWNKTIFSSSGASDLSQPTTMEINRRNFSFPFYLRRMFCRTKQKRYTIHGMYRMLLPSTWTLERNRTIF